MFMVEQEHQELMAPCLEFSCQKLANKPFTVVGDGKQKRDFTYVAMKLMQLSLYKNLKGLMEKYLMLGATLQ